MTNHSDSNRDNQEETIASETRLKALVTATADMIYRMSPDWKEMYQLEGRGILVDTNKPISDWLSTYIHPLDADKVKTRIEESIKNRSVFQLEHRVMKIDGSTGWTLSRAVPICNAKGEIQEWLGAATDITETKTIHDHLQFSIQEIEKQKRLTDTIANATPDLMYVFDLEYKFIYANEALLTMWGKTWDTAIGKGLLENGYERWHAEMHHQEIDEVRKTKKSIRGEVAFPHAVLGKRIYDYIFTPVINENGEVEAISGTTRDITEIKRSEERKNDFIGMVSHELKTPLTALTGYLELLNLKIEDQEDAVIKKAILQSIKQTKKMKSMINGFLNLSKLKSGKAHVNKTIFDFDKFMLEVEEETRLLYSTHQFIFKPMAAVQLSADQEKISQVISNLINNAVKYSPLGSVIQVTCNIRGNKLYFEVKDEGIGIDKEESSKLFARFYRVPAENLISGLGIGLYLCKEIIQQHGGEIGVESEINKGSCFWFSLALH